MKAATNGLCLQTAMMLISIHAAREGGDGITTEQLVELGISIHAAREGGDYLIKGFITICKIFQSTPPVKAATYTDI